MTGAIALPADMRPEACELEAVALAAEGVIGKTFEYPEEALLLSNEERVKWALASFDSPAGRAASARLLAWQEERPTLSVQADARGAVPDRGCAAGKVHAGGAVRDGGGSDAGVAGGGAGGGDGAGGGVG